MYNGLSHSHQFQWFFPMAIEILNAVKLGVDNELRPPDLRDLSSKSFASPVARKKSPDRP